MLKFYNEKEKVIAIMKDDGEIIFLEEKAKEKFKDKENEENQEKNKTEEE